MHRYLSVRTKLAPVIVATMVAAGALLAWGVAFTQIIIWGRSIVGTNAGVTARVDFTVEGEPQIITSWPSDLPVSSKMLTLDGKKRTGLSYSIETCRTLSGEIVEWPKPRLNRNLRAIPPARSEVRGLHRGIEIRSFPANGSLAYWYMMLDRATDQAYFWGIDAQTKRTIGSLSTSGFRTDVPPAAECFDLPTGIDGALVPEYGFSHREPAALSGGSLYNMQVSIGGIVLFVLSNETLYAVDLDSQTVRRMELPDKVISVGLAAKAELSGDKQRVIEQGHSVARLPDRLVLLDADGRASRTFLLPQPVRDRPVELLRTIGTETVLVALPENRPAADRPSAEDRKTLIYWFDAAGDVVRQAEVSLPEPAETPWADWMAATFPAPLLAAIPVISVGPSRRTSLWESWRPFSAICLAAAVAAIACFRHQRRLGGAASAWGWAALVFALGPAGLLGYWTHRRWPPRVRCEHCGTVVPRSGGICRACQAEFPPPAPQGIEVFA